MNVFLEKIGPDKKEILRNLYSLYLHDLSNYTKGLQISEDGSFEFDSFSLIWEKDGVTPYFMIVDEKLAGFVLILEAPFTTKVDKVINDFFILNPFRGKGVAKAAVSEIFAHNKGSYYISQLIKNQTAVHFWKKVYQQEGIAFVEQSEVQDGEEVVYQTFVIR
ncbi:GNAT family N-acetyltransferase [Mesobacillus boroniphilus]|uniref:GNAT family N-acetyltransferase n=1 Tax=Mesobacillus boroniphilus TaxID=308892 RepID=A0A944GX92_9BACI|nr:GNAT family N-acetyltransferase [Mesobacillus boroniphilus]MBS8265464.1 GNAT family N-acetyltransferase [Mesobacillus boroniphilus]